MRHPRRDLLLAMLAAPALARAGEPDLGLRPDPVLGASRVPAEARGAAVWLHGGYRDGDPPDAAPFLGRMAAAGWDVWRQDRPPFGRDPLAPAAEALAAGTQRLREAGYGQVVLVGESRGAFVALVALRFPRLADAALLLAPAAHGPRPERRPQALADYRAALDAMAPDALRRAALALFEGDPYDPDPPARAAAFLAAMRARGLPALLLNHPAVPAGHGGGQDPEFVARYGTCVLDFLTGALAGPALRDACALPALTLAPGPAAEARPR